MKRPEPRSGARVENAGAAEILIMLTSLIGISLAVALQTLALCCAP